MDPALASLIAACTTFVGSHFVLSHPLRAPLIRFTGEKGFPALYSLVAFASFGWVVMAFRAVPAGTPLWDGMADAPWIAATLVMLVASVLLVGSFKGNPAMPAPGAADLAAKGPHGVFHSTRHPMMWAFALWSLAHVLVSPTPAVLVLAGAMAVLALLGSHFQDRKKEAAMGEAWKSWESQTNFAPRLGRLAWAGAGPWIGGIILWLAATWAHGWLISMPAGLWRWLG